MVVAGPYVHHSHAHSHSHTHHMYSGHGHNHHTHTHTHTHGGLISTGNDGRGGGMYGAYTGNEKVVVSNIQVYDAIKYFPRHTLGVVTYRPMSDEIEEELEEVRMTEDELEGYPGVSEATTAAASIGNSSNSSIGSGGLPSLEGHENSVLYVRIARKYLSRATNTGVRERRLWGTDIYTDDSDVVAVLYHMGFLPPESNYSENGYDQDKNITPAGIQAELDGDCLVTLVALPRLERYVGSYRNGLYSRTWVRVPHDGASFQVVSVRFVSRGSGPFESSGLSLGSRVADGVGRRDYYNNIITNGGVGGVSGVSGDGGGESNGFRVAAWMEEFHRVFEDTEYGDGPVAVSHTREDRYPGIQWRSRGK